MQLLKKAIIRKYRHLNLNQIKQSACLPSVPCYGMGVGGAPSEEFPMLKKTSPNLVCALPFYLKLHAGDSGVKMKIVTFFLAKCSLFLATTKPFTHAEFFSC